MFRIPACITKLKCEHELSLIEGFIYKIERYQYTSYIEYTNGMVTNTSSILYRLLASQINKSKLDDVYIVTGLVCHPNGNQEGLLNSNKP